MPDPVGSETAVAQAVIEAYQRVGQAEQRGLLVGEAGIGRRLLYRLAQAQLGAAPGRGGMHAIVAVELAAGLEFTVEPGACRVPGLLPEVARQRQRPGVQGWCRETRPRARRCAGR